MDKKTVLSLVLSGDVVKKEEGVWAVRSSFGDMEYEVRWQGTGGSCTCKGYQFRSWCRHLDIVRALENAS